MPLSDYQEASVTLPIGGTTITLHPLSLSDLAILRTRHVETVLLAIAPYLNDLRCNDASKVQLAMVGMVSDLSAPIADAICLSAREPDAMSCASRLPLDFQIAAIFNSQGGETPQSLSQVLAIGDEQVSTALRGTANERLPGPYAP